MEPYTKGTAEIRHRTTGVVYEIESDELEWEQNGGEERGMGSELRYEAIVEHPHLGTLTWALWEYPLGIENNDDTDVGRHEVIKNFDFGLEHVPDAEDEYWLNDDTPPDPFRIYHDSYHMTGDLLADHGGLGGGHLLNRMIFSHQITALEAYLGDTLINATLNDPAAMGRLMEKDTELNKQKFTLVQIAEEPDLVERRVRTYLQEILYHNLERVNFLYSTALQFQILPLAKDSAALIAMIKLRHDCVHRNGFNKDGTQLTMFTKQYVQAAADMIREFVEKIEKQVLLVSRPPQPKAARRAKSTLFPNSP